MKFEIRMKLENQLAKKKAYCRSRRVSVERSKRQKRRGVAIGARDRQKKAILEVLKNWAAGELSRNTPELE